MVSVCHTNHHCTSIPCAAVPLCDSGTWNHTSRFDGCSCFAQNPNGERLWQQLLTDKVCVCAHAAKACLVDQAVLYRGQNLCGREGEIERRGLRERERERKRHQPRSLFHSLQIFFPAGHQKVLVTPKQLHHCFDNSDTPTHSCWTWTTVHCTLVRFINVSPKKSAFSLFRGHHSFCLANNKLGTSPAVRKRKKKVKKREVNLLVKEKMLLF